jgi:DOMON domain
MKLTKVWSFVVAATLAIAAPTQASISYVTVAKIEDASADCSDYTHAAQLAGDVLMVFVLTSSKLSVRLEVSAEKWVAFGISPDSRGKMVGSDAIIGLPLAPLSQSNPGKYIMDGESVSSVYLRDDAAQTLTNGNVWQENGKTYLAFTKQLEESDEYPISSTGENYFLWAYGYENDLTGHDQSTAAGSFVIDAASTLCIPAASAPEANPVSSPAATPVSSPVSTPVGSPVSTSVSSPVATPVSSPVADNAGKNGSGVAVDKGVSNSTSATCSDYQNLVQINEKLAMSYVVNGPTSSNDTGTISIKLEFDGEAWISLGVSPDGSGKMIGGEAVIALPGEAVSAQNPGEFFMSSQDSSGVVLMGSELQTLINGTIAQENGKTIATFTKKLSEPNKSPILGSGHNTFIWAYGYSNTFSVHQGEGSFSVALSPCTESNGLQTENLSSESFSENKKNRMWRAHAILGLIAWGFLAPCAFSSSRFRKLLAKWDGLWFKIHFYCNIVVLLTTFTAFIIAVVVYNDESNEHFASNHEAMGLAITVLVTLQAASGIFRPSLPKHKSAEDNSDEDGSQLSPDESDEPIVPVEAPADSAGVEVSKSDSRATKNDFSAKESSGAPTSARSKVRIAWEVCHKVLGVTLLVLGLWQVHSGIDLYAETFGTTDYSTAFWGVLGAYIGFFLLLTLYVRRFKQNQ